MANLSLAGAGRRPRLAAIDAVRGAAVLAMIVYHFSWDLSDFRLTAVNVVSDPAWRAFARVIASTFLVLVGVGLVFATAGGFRPLAFARRVAVIGVAAALVSLGTWWFTPGAFVFFGILHMIAVGSVLALPFLRLPSVLVAISAAAVFVAPFFFTSAFFDSPALWWIGLSSDPPPTVDYVPILPWFSAILVGILLGRFLSSNLPETALGRWSPAGPASALLVAAGRWSLAIYLLHQPLLIGVLSLLAPYLPANPAAENRAFAAECTTTCRAVGEAPPVCELYCACVFSAIAGTDLMLASRGGMDSSQETRWNGIVDQCRKTARPSLEDAPFDE